MEVRDVTAAASSPEEGEVAGDILDIESFVKWHSCRPGHDNAQ